MLVDPCHRFNHDIAAMMNQQPAVISLPSLGRAAKPVFFSREEPAWNEVQPSRKAVTTTKA